MSDSPYLLWIEWEPCAESVTLGISDPIEGLPPGPESITIRRDDQYRLVADLGGTTNAEAYAAYHQTLRETVPGTMRADGVDVAARHLTGSARVRLSVGGSSNVIHWTRRGSLGPPRVMRTGSGRTIRIPRPPCGTPTGS